MMTQFSYAGLSKWELDIINRYPDIYLTPNSDISEVHISDKEHFCNLRYGFEFNEGWAKLVDDFSKITTDFITEIRKIQSDAYVRAFIFKEKFGVLNWQGDDNLNEPFRTVYHAYVTSIERQSAHICEKTGKYGKVRNIGGWVSTLSDEEYQKALDKKSN